MTTEEEVLRLAKAAGLYRSGMHNNEYHWTGTESEITKLIELAKQAGAAEEREGCAKWAVGWFDNHPEDIANAIRNRERKEK